MCVGGCCHLERFLGVGIENGCLGGYDGKIDGLFDKVVGLIIGKC